jgi:short-subunit dehydrogenase
MANLLERQLGAITQPLRMEHHQTQINATELMGKFMPTGIESSTSRAISPKKSDKRWMLSEKRYLAYISG